jgi:PAS domain S-box-containing protein
MHEILNNPDVLYDIIDTMTEGLMVIDRNSKILFFNRAAEEITGFNRNDVIGRPCTVIDGDACRKKRASGSYQKCMLFENGGITKMRCQLRANDGREIHLLKNAVLLKNKAGEVIGAVELMTDITSLHLKDRTIEQLKNELMQEYGFMGIIGTSPPMQRLYEQIRNAAAGEAPVIITGESGTGKELVARAIHRLSRRQNGPFVTVNCAALNEFLLESELFGHIKGAFTGAVRDRKGRFEAAQNGSLFLDEIGDMPLSMQAKLLRVLQEREIERVGDQKPIRVDVRLMSATNKNIEEQLRAGNFRDDLFYRINVIPIHVPPLRQRVEDIPHLIAHYLERINQINRKSIRHINPNALEAIEAYAWPGNVRQLINMIEYATMTAQSDSIELSDLPEYIFPKDSHKRIADRTRKDHLSKAAIQTTLQRFVGNRTKSAQHLGVSRVTLWKLIKKYGLEGQD